MFELSQRLIGIYKTSNQTRSKSTPVLFLISLMFNFPLRHLHQQQQYAHGLDEDVTRNGRTRTASVVGSLCSLASSPLFPFGVSSATNTIHISLVSAFQKLLYS
jgi:hypothetical protein